MGKSEEWCSAGLSAGATIVPHIYINDLDQGLKCKVSKFADDTKVATAVKNNDGCINDLNKLFGWADKWQMDFNSKKCKVLHIGYSNKEFNYDMNGEWLQLWAKKKIWEWL